MNKIKAVDKIVFNVISKAVIGFISLVCLIPFIMVISGSISEESEILRNGYSLLPRGFSLDAYQFIVQNPRSILNAYGVTIFVTFTAIVMALFLISMTAYVLYRKDFKYRNTFSFIFYFTTIFNGGLLPTYIMMVSYLHLKDNILALILPNLINVFFLLVMRSFISGTVPESIIESAKIDGANDFYIYWKIILPLIKVGLITIGLFEAVGYWNNWVNAMLYINDKRLYPLQYVLYQLLQSTQAYAQSMADTGGSGVQLPSETFKLSMTIVTTGPIILAYPFLQRYFVQGVTIGAVKG